MKTNNMTVNPLKRIIKLQKIIFPFKFNLIKNHLLRLAQKTLLAQTIIFNSKKQKKPLENFMFIFKLYLEKKIKTLIFPKIAITTLNLLILTKVHYRINSNFK